MDEFRTDQAYVDADGDLWFYLDHWYYLCDDGSGLSIDDPHVEPPEGCAPYTPISQDMTRVLLAMIEQAVVA